MPEPPPVIKIVLPVVFMLIVYSCSIVRCGSLCGRQPEIAIRLADELRSGGCLDSSSDSQNCCLGTDHAVWLM
jgi:hypothetical protein